MVFGNKKMNKYYNKDITLVNFFQEHDKRRGTDFRKVFPELADFYNDCLEIKL